MQVIISSINKQLYQGRAKSVILPTQDGEIQILPEHAPFWGLLSKGPVKVDNQVIPISSGIVQVENDQIIVLVEQS